MGPPAEPDEDALADELIAAEQQLPPLRHL